MLCFEVSINGEKLGVAGVGLFGVMTVMLGLRIYDSVEANTKGELTELLNLRVGGMSEEEHLTWMSGPVHVGDNIEVRIVDVIEADSPLKREPSDHSLERDGRRRELAALSWEFENEEESVNLVSEAANAALTQPEPKTCFEISLNGKKLCLAGIAGRGVLTSSLTWVKVLAEQLTSKRDPRQGIPRLEAGALVGDESQQWLSRRVNEGDLISYRILLSEVVDEPKRRIQSDPVEEKKARRAFYERSKREFEGQ